jgi:diaminohydroxyphosphoribosylaminopyrimidine deaminase / 5-amino-6-(5-phosphoribosylamino)uracil reductase
VKHVILKAFYVKCRKMTVSGNDLRFMDAAIRLARRHAGWTGTNPSVSCVLVRDDGSGPYICGSGVTAIGGRPHAEPIALAEAGDKACGATAYVTLEPCAHHGKTAPCAQTLIDGGVIRVVSAVVDPDSRVNERGHGMLRTAGITVETGLRHELAAVDLAPYLTHKRYGRPYVRLKLAVSADGYLGIRGHGQIAITGAIARAQSHTMRARHQAILVGAGTVAEDNPELTCRLPGLEHRSPTRIVVDPNGRLSGREKMVQTARYTPTWVVAPPGRHQHELTEAGCVMMACETLENRVVLPELLEDIGARGIMSLLVEGGADIAKSFLNEDIVDEIALFAGTVELNPPSGKAVMSPILPGTSLKGFQLTDEWCFGDDQLQIYRRAR